MLESDGRTQQAEALDGDVSKCLRKSPQSDEFITSETGVSTKQKGVTVVRLDRERCVTSPIHTGAGTTDVIRSNTQSIVGDQLPDYTVRSPLRISDYGRVSCCYTVLWHVAIRSKSGDVSW